MAGALVQGGPGTEIALNAILPSHLRGASRQRREAIARDYEAHHPGAIVVCDWEIIGDSDIAEMHGEEREQALADRAALNARRKAAAEMGEQPESKMGGDPERARELLRRARNEMERLDPRTDAKAYQKRFRELHAQINELEDACGQPRTTYKMGETIESKFRLSPTKAKEYEAKVQKYRSFPVANRRQSIEDAVDPILAQMLFDVESEPKLRDMWALKLVALGVQAA